MKCVLFMTIWLCFTFGTTFAQNEEKIKELVKFYTAQLQDKNKDNRGTAAEKLGQIGPAAKMAIPELSKLYGEEKNSWVRKMIIGALWKIGAEYKSARDIIIKAIKLDPTDEVRVRAIEICGYIGKRMGDDVVPYLLSLTREGPMEVKREALRSLKKMGKLTQQSVPETILEVMAVEREVEMLSLCSDILGNLEETGKGTVPKLLESLKKPHPRLQVAAARALGKIGEEGEEIIPILTKYLQSGDEEMRLEMILAISDFGPKGSKKAGTYLKKYCKDKNNAVQQAAIEAVGNLGPLADSSLEKYLEFLSKDKKNTTMAATAKKSLEKMQFLKNQQSLQNVERILGIFAGSDTKEIEKGKEELIKAGMLIVPRLGQALREEDRKGKEYICAVLKEAKWSEEYKNTLTALAETAIYGTPEVKISALKALAKTGDFARELLPYIVDGLSAEHAEVKIASAETLGELGGDIAKDGILSLTYILKDGDASVRMASVLALGRIKASSAKEALKEALKEETDSEVKEKMESILNKL